MNAIELLKEARDALYDEMHGVHNGSFTDGLERRNRKDTLIATIDAYLSAPNEDAMEVARVVEAAIKPQYIESPNGRGGVMVVSKDYTEAAALIESYGRRVPRAMLEEVANYARKQERNDAKGIDIGDIPFERIAAKYGVKVEG